MEGWIIPNGCGVSIGRDEPQRNHFTYSNLNSLAPPWATVAVNPGIFISAYLAGIKCLLGRLIDTNLIYYIL
jgi:hypothetical protein